MHNLKNRKKNNSKVTATATTLIVLGAILIVANLSTPLGAPIHLLQSAQAFIDPTANNVAEPRKAPVVVSGDNIYIAWWNNNTSENGNKEIMFRGSTDGDATFSERINLSNTTEADLWRVEIQGESDTVVVSWWEMNQTCSDIPVAKSNQRCRS